MILGSSRVALYWKMIITDQQSGVLTLTNSSTSLTSVVFSAFFTFEHPHIYSALTKRFSLAHVNTEKISFFEEGRRKMVKPKMGPAGARKNCPKYHCS